MNNTDLFPLKFIIESGYVYFELNVLWELKTLLHLDGYLHRVSSLLTLDYQSSSLHSLIPIVRLWDDG